MDVGKMFERLHRQFGEPNADERETYKEWLRSKFKDAVPSDIDEAVEMYINDMGRDY